MEQLDDTLVIPILTTPLLNWNRVRIYFHSTVPHYIVPLEDNTLLSLMFFLATFESIEQLAVTCVKFEHFCGLYSTVVTFKHTYSKKVLKFTATQVAPLTEMLHAS